MLAAQRGTVFVEYLLLIVLVSIPASWAISRLGRPLLRMHQYTALVLSGPLP